MPDVEIRADCPWCGEVAMSATEYRCPPVRDGAVVLCRFACPICSREIFAPLSAAAARTLLVLGALPVHGPLPYELLESHEGPPVSWDDVLDLRNELESTCCPQDELTAHSVEQAAVGEPIRARSG